MENIVNNRNTVPTANLDIVRSWKDPRYRRSLSAQQLQTLPEHPAGPAMLTDQELKVAGGLDAGRGFFHTTDDGIGMHRVDIPQLEVMRVLRAANISPACRPYLDSSSN